MSNDLPPVWHSALILQSLLNIPLVLVQWSSKCTTPLYHGSSFNDLFVQSGSPPGLNIIHGTTLMSNSLSVLPLGPFHLPFHLCSLSILPFSQPFSSSHLCLCVLLGLSPWRPVWALRPMSGLANISAKKEWKRREVRERGGGGREKEREKRPDPKHSQDMAAKNTSVWESESNSPALIIF